MGLEFHAIYIGIDRFAESLYLAWCVHRVPCVCLYVYEVLYRMGIVWQQNT